MANKPLKTRTAHFLERARESLKPDDMLDFSKVEYVNNRTHVTIIDRSLRPDGTEYGEFKITPSNFLKGKRHPDKKGLRIAKAKTTPLDKLLERFRKAHPDEDLDYSQVEYVDLKTPVKIISHELRPDGTEYGEFWQRPEVHLRGSTHPDYARDRKAGQYHITDETFRKRLLEIFKDELYDFSETKYAGRDGLATVRCLLHGQFSNTTENLYNGVGCPICDKLNSVAENTIYRWLISAVGKNNVFCNVKGVIENHELDFYLPEHNLAIEYNGLHWHSERVGRDRMYHFNKTRECHAKGIRLIHIFEDEFLTRKEIVKTKILRILGVGFKYHINSESCEIRPISRQDAKLFATTHHLRGYKAATSHYGAFCGDVIVGMMSFLSLGPESEISGLMQFAEHHDYKVDGLFAAMFEKFIHENNVSEVSTLLDCCWDGMKEDLMLRNVGFVLDSYVPPIARYTDGHRKRLRPIEYIETLDKRKMNKYHRIWNSGFMRYVYKQ